jgi:hypothetical protein
VNRYRRAYALALAAGSALSACGSCKKGEADGAPVASSSAFPVVAEAIPRCRAVGDPLALPGDDVIVGDVAIGPSELLVGLIRNDRGKRTASVLRASLDLSKSKVVNVGPALGDDPPPSPRYASDSAHVAFFARSAADAGSGVRELRVARLDDDALGKIEGTSVQQADESMAFDVAWGESGGLVTWDEDAPPRLDASVRRDTYAPEGRGFVKVQALGADARRVASPESSDAESPALIARPGGYWLAWLARRAEDDGYEVESPGEKRAFRWVEVVPLDAKGDPAGPVRRVSPEKGRAMAFELARSVSDLVVLVQDEAAASEGAGARISRYVVGDRIESTDVASGVGGAVAELVQAVATSTPTPWLAWSDTAEHAHVTPLGVGLVAAGPSTLEPSLDGARVLAASGPETVFAFSGGAGEPGASAPRAAQIRRFACTPKNVGDAGNAAQ